MTPWSTRLTVLLAATLLLGSGSARALPPDADAWIRIETDGLTLLSNAGEARTRRLAADLERLRSSLTRLDPDFLPTSPTPTFVFVFRDGRSLSPYRLVFEGKPVDVGGYFLSRPEASYVAIDADPRGDARAIVYHELLHSVLRNHYPGLPLWLHEGVAELYSTVQAERGEARIGQPIEEHVRWLATSPLLPLSELFALDSRSSDYHQGPRRGGVYAQSWALAHYLFIGSEARREPVRRYLRTLARGEAPDEAFRAAFGGDLEGELRTYVRRGLFRPVQAPAGPGGEPDLRVAPLPRAERLASLGLLLSFLDRSRWPAAEEHLKAALEESPEHPAAMAGLGVLAELSGRSDEARSWLERAARSAPDDFLIQYRFGLNRLAQGPEDRTALPQARDALARAVALRPDFADAWARLGYALSFETPQPAEALQALETAHRLRPSDPETAYNLMLARLRSGKAKQAEALIRVIAAEGGPADAERARAVWVEELRGDVERRLARGDLDGSLPLLEELSAQASGEQRAAVARRLAEVREAIAYNRFGERYDQAVRLAGEGKIDQALDILTDLAGNAPTPGQAAEARRLLEQLRQRRRQ